MYKSIYINVSKCIQDLQRYAKIYEIPRGGGAAPPGPVRGVWYSVYLGMSLDMLLDMCLVWFWYSCLHILVSFFGGGEVYSCSGGV